MKVIRDLTILYILIIVFFSNNYLANVDIKLDSPNKALSYNFELIDGKLFYQILHKEKLIIDRSQLGYRFESNMDLVENFEFVDSLLTTH